MPALAWTYATLLQALQDWPVHASAKYLVNLPTLIGLGERRLWGDLNVEEYDKDDATQLAVIGNPIAPKPADVVQVRSVGITVAGKYVGLEKRSLEYCRNFGAHSTGAAPQYYTEYTFASVYLAPSPDIAYPLVYHYLGALPESLTAASPNATTWLSRAAADGLFTACLAEAEQYIKADDRYDDYMKKYTTELLPRIRAELRKSIRAGDYSPMQSAAAIAQ